MASSGSSSNVSLCGSQAGQVVDSLRPFLQPTGALVTEKASGAGAFCEKHLTFSDRMWYIFSSRFDSWLSTSNV